MLARVVGTAQSGGCFGMDAGTRRENAVLPPPAGPGTDLAPPIDADAAAVADLFDGIARDAAVAFEIGVDARGNFIDARTGEVDGLVAATYSRMKHGDLDAVNFFARHLAATAMRSERFVSLNQQAVSAGRVIYITTTAVFNTPSASNLLLRATATQLNIGLTRLGLAPVVVVEQTRLSDNSLGYPSRSVGERRGESAPGRGVTIVPAQFREQSLIFVDDLFNSGYTVKRAEARMRRIEVADRFYLLAARMDPRAVVASQGAVEDRLNEAVVTGTLESTAPLLQAGNFVAVQKLLRVILNPEHTDQLAEFLQTIPTASILKVYTAAADDNFRGRNARLYLPSLLALETVLEERGALDPIGHVVSAPPPASHD